MQPSTIGPSKPEVSPQAANERGMSICSPEGFCLPEELARAPWSPSPRGPDCIHYRQAATPECCGTASNRPDRPSRFGRSARIPVPLPCCSAPAPMTTTASPAGSAFASDAPLTPCPRATLHYQLLLAKKLNGRCCATTTAGGATCRL